MWSKESIASDANGELAKRTLIKAKTVRKTCLLFTVRKSAWQYDVDDVLWKFWIDPRIFPDMLG